VCRLDRAIVAGVLEGFGCGKTEVRGHASMIAGNDVCVREVRAYT
jgi:predicted hydrocarbon binding protein